MNSGSDSSASYLTHRDVRRTEAVVLLVCGLTPAALTWIPAFYVGSNRLPWFWGLVPAMAILTLGLWYARDWARWMVAIADVAFAVSCTWLAWTFVSRGQILPVIGPLGFGGIVAAGAYYSLHPAVKRRFAEAREAMTRIRAQDQSSRPHSV